MPDLQDEHGVFVNCPFDDAYRPLFEAVVFTLHDCGYVAHSALEVTDGSQVRIEKISVLIAGCKFGLHDISRTEPDAVTGLPRFNMPLELGLFLGAKRFGTGKQRVKNCLALDVDRYPLSEVHLGHRGAGHSRARRKPAKAIRVVRDWLSDARSIVKSRAARRSLIDTSFSGMICQRQSVLGRRANGPTRARKHARAMFYLATVLARSSILREDLQYLSRQIFTSVYQNLTWGNTKPVTKYELKTIASSIRLL